jgi:hypothetical protein
MLFVQISPNKSNGDSTNVLHERAVAGSWGAKVTEVVQQIIAIPEKDKVGNSTFRWHPPPMLLPALSRPPYL